MTALNLSQELSEYYYDTLYHSPPYSISKYQSSSDTATSLRQPLQSAITSTQHNHYELIISKQQKLISTLKRVYTSEIKTMQAKIQTLTSYLSSLVTLDSEAETQKMSEQDMHKAILTRLVQLKSKVAENETKQQQMLQSAAQMKQEIHSYQGLKKQFQKSLLTKTQNEDRLSKVIEELNSKIKSLETSLSNSKATVTTPVAKSTIPVFVSSHKEKKISVVVEKIVEKVVQKVVEKAVERVVEKIVYLEKPIYIKEQVPVFVEMEVPVFIERVIQKIVEKPILVTKRPERTKQKIIYVDKPVFVDREIEKVVFKEKIQKVIEPIFVDREVQKIVILQPVQGPGGVQLQRVQQPK